MNRTNRIHRLAAVAITAITLSLTFLACNKKDSDNPNPQNPSGITACRPSQMTRDSKVHYRYLYDSQGRLSQLTESQYNGSQDVDVPTYVSYEGDDIVMVSTSTFGSQYTTTSRFKRNSAGKFLYAVTSSPAATRRDTVYYFYETVNGQERFQKLVGSHNRNGSFSDSVGYAADGLPVLKALTFRDSLGRRVSATHWKYVYDTHKVDFNPYAPFYSVPGIAFVKADRMVRQMREVNYYFDTGNKDSAVTNYTVSSYWQGKDLPEQVRVEYTDRFGTSPSLTEVFSYQCE